MGFAQEERRILDVRGPTTHLSKVHNRQKSSGFKLGFSLASQLPLETLAVAVDNIDPTKTADFVAKATFHGQLSIAFMLFHRLEIFGFVGFGLWSADAVLDAAIFESLTLDLSMFEGGAGALYKFFSGDILPYLIVYFGGSSTTADLFKNNDIGLQEGEQATLFYGGAGAGVEVYLTPHCGFRIQFVGLFYNDLVDLDVFIGGGGIEQADLPERWVNLLITTGLFYEF